MAEPGIKWDDEPVGQTPTPKAPEVKWDTPEPKWDKQEPADPLISPSIPERERAGKAAQGVVKWDPPPVKLGPPKPKDEGPAFQNPRSYTDNPALGGTWNQSWPDWVKDQPGNFIGRLYDSAKELIQFGGYSAASILHPAVILSDNSGLFEKEKRELLKLYSNKLGYYGKEFNQLPIKERTEIVMRALMSGGENVVGSVAQEMGQKSAGENVASLLLGQQASQAVKADSLAPIYQNPGGAAADLLMNWGTLAPIRHLGVAAGSRLARDVGAHLPGQFNIPREIGATTEVVGRPRPQQDVMHQLAMPWGQEEFTNRAGASAAYKKVPDGGPILPHESELAPLFNKQQEAAAALEVWRKAREAYVDLRDSGDKPGQKAAKAQVTAARAVRKRLIGEQTALEEQLGPFLEKYKEAEKYWNDVTNPLIESNAPTPAQRSFWKEREAAIRDFMGHFPNTDRPDLAQRVETGDIYRQLVETRIWDKARAQEALDTHLGLGKDKPLGQLEFKFHDDPGVRSARVTNSQLIVEYAREHPNPGMTTTQKVIVPATIAEKILGLGLNRFRLGDEIVNVANEIISNRELAERDAIRQAKQIEEAGKIWGKGYYDYFTDPHARSFAKGLGESADPMDNFAYASKYGSGIMDAMHERIVKDSAELRRRGVIDVGPEFYQNYITQSHMLLYEIPGWKPPQGIIDRFISETRKSASANGHPMTHAAVRQMVEDFYGSKKPLRVWLGQTESSLPPGPEVGALFKRTNMPDWVRDMYGPVPAGPYGYAQTRIAQVQALLNDTFYRYLEGARVPAVERPMGPGGGPGVNVGASIVSETPLAGYTQLTDRQWGRLQGKYIADDYLPVLSLVGGTAPRALFSKLLDSVKWWWVIPNVPTWERNMLGNVMFTVLNDALPRSPGEIAAWGRAAADVGYWVRTGGEMTSRMRAMAEKGAIASMQIGRSGDIVGFLKNELGDLEGAPRGNMERILTSLIPRYPADHIRAGNMARQDIASFLERVYLAQDTYVRLGNLYTHMARGYSMEQAIGELTKWHPNYMLSSPIAAALKGRPQPAGASWGVSPGVAQAANAFASPVPSFTFETARIYERAAREKPLHLAALMSLPLLWNTGMMAISGGNPGDMADMVQSLPDYTRSRSFLLIPTKRGMHWMDIDSVLPNSQLTGGTQQFFSQFINSPIVDAVAEMNSGVDSLTGQRIVQPGQNWFEVWAKRLTARSSVPPMVPKTYELTRLAAERGRTRVLGAEFEEGPVGAFARGVSPFGLGSAVAPFTEGPHPATVPLEALQQSGTRQRMMKMREDINAYRGLKNKALTPEDIQKRMREIGDDARSIYRR